MAKTRPMQDPQRVIRQLTQKSGQTPPKHAEQLHGLHQTMWIRKHYTFNTAPRDPLVSIVPLFHGRSHTRRLVNLGAASDARGAESSTRKPKATMGASALASISINLHSRSNTTTSSDCNDHNGSKSSDNCNSTSIRLVLSLMFLVLLLLLALLPLLLLSAIASNYTYKWLA